MLRPAAASTGAIGVALFGAASAGAFSFSVTPPTETAPGPRAVVIARPVPKAGPSVVVPSADNPEFWQFRLGATGRLEVFAKYSQVPGPSSAIGVADFDRRFADDLAIVNTRTNGVSIHRSMTSVGLFVPQFDANNEPDAYATGLRPIAVATGQLDVADSPPDVATANVGDGTVTTGATRATAIFATVPTRRSGTIRARSSSAASRATAPSATSPWLLPATTASWCSSAAADN